MQELKFVRVCAIQMILIYLLVVHTYKKNLPVFSVHNICSISI